VQGRQVFIFAAEQPDCFPEAFELPGPGSFVRAGLSGALPGRPFFHHGRSLLPILGACGVSTPKHENPVFSSFAERRTPTPNGISY